jgi:hypothetical protein
MGEERFLPAIREKKGKGKDDKPCPDDDPYGIIKIQLSLAE